MEKAKRIHIAHLYHARHTPTDISHLVGCSRTTVYGVIKKLNTTGCLDRSPHGPPANKKRTPEFLEDLASKIKSKPTTSQTSLAKDMNVTPKTMGQAIRDLGMKSRARPPKHLLTEAYKENHVTRSKKLLTWLKNHKDTIKIFSDKKMFVVDQAYNRRNDRFISSSSSEVKPVPRTKHPQGVMMLGVVGSDGKKMPPFFFDQGLKINQKVYENVLKTVVKPWLDATYPHTAYVFQQDSAPAHKAKKTQDWCKEHLRGFWPAEFWPPQSPDLNPLDYSIWSIVERDSNKTSHKNIADLKASICQAWEAMEEEYVVKVCRRFRPRLEAVVKAKGGYIE